MDARPLLPLIILAGAGCGVVGHVDAPAPVAVTSLPATATAAALPVTPSARARARAGRNGIIAPGTGERLIVNVGSDGSGHVLTRILVVRKDGEVVSVGTVPGSWDYPEPVAGAPLEGISWDGSRVVLVATDDQSRFVAVPTTEPRARPVVVHPAGDFTFDAVSHDGRRLLLVEHGGAGRRTYRIRAVDLPSGAMQAAPVVDKTETKAMVGVPVARATTVDFVYTVYEPTAAPPFVHALDAGGTYALCLDLPAERDPAARGAWRAATRGPAAVTISNTVTRISYGIVGGKLHSIPYEQWPE